MGIPQNRCPREAWRDLFEQFEPLGRDSVFKRGKPSAIAARPRHALDETGAHRIGDRHENDRHRASCALQCAHADGAIGQNDIRHECDQFCRVPVKAVGNARCPTHVHPHIATLDPSQLL